MAKPTTVAECVHHWANQVAHKGVVAAKCGSVRYEGEVLYSYAACIAILDCENNVAVLSDHTWSVTTSKHQSYARRSVPPHYTVVRAPHIGTSFNLMHRENKSTFEKEVVRLLDTFKKHPRRKSLLSNVESIRHRYNAYSEAFGLNWPEINVDSVRAELDAEAERLERAHEERRRARAEQARRAAAEEQLDLLRWRNGEDIHRHFITTALRLSTDGQFIETSRGAAVPVEVAWRLWTAANSYRERSQCWIPLRPFKVGHYNLDKIGADGSLHIGCHNIPFTELELMAAKLGFTQPDEVINRDAEIC